MKKENMKKLRAQAEELVQKLTLDEKIGMVGRRSSRQKELTV